MTNKTTKPVAPKLALEIAKALTRDGTLQEALRKAGQFDLQKHLPLSMQIDDLARKSTARSSLLDTLKRNRGAGDSLTEALKQTNLADQLRKIGMGQPGSIHSPETMHRDPHASGSLIQSVSDVGTAIRAERKAKGMTQQQFADLAGVGRRFLSELESGKPTSEIGKVLKVAAAVGLRLMIVPVSQTNE
jgi:y4mF family transcriptional regulator